MAVYQGQSDRLPLRLYLLYLRCAAGGSDRITRADRGDDRHGGACCPAVSIGDPSAPRRPSRAAIHSGPARGKCETGGVRRRDRVGRCPKPPRIQIRCLSPDTTASRQDCPATCPRRRSAESRSTSTLSGVSRTARRKRVSSSGARCAVASGAISSESAPNTRVTALSSVRSRGRMDWVNIKWFARAVAGLPPSDPAEIRPWSHGRAASQ